MLVESEQFLILFNFPEKKPELENYTAEQMIGNVTPDCYDC